MADPPSWACGWSRPGRLVGHDAAHLGRYQEDGLRADVQSPACEPRSFRRVTQPREDDGQAR
jgi:hypothetical protein